VNDAIVVPRTPLAGLRAWLEYDESRVEDVETAYRTFVEQARMGLWLTLALVFSFVALVVVAVAMYRQGTARMTQVMLPTIMVTFYGTLAFPLLFVKRDVHATIMRGCVNLGRGVVFGVLLGFACAIVESVLFTVLWHAPVKRPPSVDLFSNGVLMGLVMLLLAAPFVEEFLMQGWLQTRLQRFGPVWGGILTTIVFVVFHVPTTVFELVRGLVLAAAAVLRASTRSLAACIAVHFANNFFFAAILLLSHAFTKQHHA
jgi:membrane protease YdiL (CAAX protease family)